MVHSCDKSYNLNKKTVLLVNLFAWDKSRTPGIHHIWFAPFIYFQYIFILCKTSAPKMSIKWERVAKYGNTGGAKINNKKKRNSFRGYSDKKTGGQIL